MFELNMCRVTNSIRASVTIQLVLNLASQLKSRRFHRSLFHCFPMLSYVQSSFVRLWYTLCNTYMATSPIQPLQMNLEVCIQSFGYNSSSCNSIDTILMKNLWQVTCHHHLATLLFGFSDQVICNFPTFCHSEWPIQDVCSPILTQSGTSLNFEQFLNSSRCSLGLSQRRSWVLLSGDLPEPAQ